MTMAAMATARGRRGFLLIAAGAAVAAAAGARAQTPATTAPAAIAPPPAAPAPLPPPPLPAPGPVSPPPELEAIRSVVVGRRGLTLRLATHGCTAKADIVHFVERRAGVTTVAFARKRIETCGRGRPGEVSLDFSFKDLGIDADEPVVVLNPLLAAPVRSRR